MAPASLLAGILLLSTGAGAVDDAPLARWRGGELTRPRLVELADPSGEALALGGDRLREAACKATFLEIYSDRALATGLERDPEVRSRLEQARREILGAAWEKRHRPTDDALVPESAARAAYDGDASGRWSVAEVIEIDLLVVRCDLAEPGRAVCRERRDTLERRLASGEDLAALAGEEMSRTGAANGHFRLAARALDRDLGAAVAKLAPGETSGWIETLQGFTRLRLTAREAGRRRPFAEIAGTLRGTLLGEAQQAWRTAEATRLRPTLPGLPAGAAPDEVFAAAAAAQGLDREEGVAAALERRRVWVLADAAFLIDPELTPGDAEVAAARFRLAERLTRYRLLVATVDAGEDLATAFARAARLRSALAGATDPSAALRAVAATDPAIRLDELPPATAGELRRRSPHLADVALDLAGGDGTDSGNENPRWRGPDAVAWTAVPPATRAATVHGDGRGLAFVVLVEVAPPGDDEVRLELRRELRGRIGGGTEAFLAVMGPRWGVELLVP